MSSVNIEEYDAVVFDLDSTLMNTHRYPLVASQWLMTQSNVDVKRYGEIYLRNLVGRYFKAIEEIVTGAPFRTPFDIVKTAMGESLSDIGYDPDPEIVEEATQRFRSLHIELSSPYEGVSEILSTLKKRGIKMGIVTNSFEGNAKIILDNYNLTQYFQAIIDCGKVRAYKPMPEPFEGTLSLMDVFPSETILVGDEYYADMVGGKQVEMTTIWINHRDNSLDELVAKYGPENSPDFVLTSISEFAELL